MCEREVIRLPAGCKGGELRMGEWAYGRVGLVLVLVLGLVGGDVGFSEPSALGGELLAANLLICYLIDRPSARGGETEDICGCLPPNPLFLKP
jgi:hypothetical protein